MDPTEQLERAGRMIADLRKRLAEHQEVGSDAIAVIGMGCRFPGEARDCDGYWRMIEDGRDAIRPIPPHRARDMAPDNLRHAALVDDIETFDAAFFDISPREAGQMDPQQRLFLDVAWEALEDAGQTRSTLAGSATGVFVGVHNHSSGYLELQTADVSRLNEYTAVGSAHDVIAGRLAYVFDFRGPSVVVNTACSSSLVAVHMACQSVLSRDCRMAVAGGVNLILGPMQSRIVGLGAMLAVDGRCKTFDSRANGYGRGEGCGAVVLKRLSDAIDDRDRILAVIRASAVNQDGRTNGLTAPNGLAQQALLRRTLARAGLDPTRIGYVETHGTGTALGDPIEVEAIASVYGGSAPGAARCGLGSAKSNINHLEGAAGIAGLIRAILIVRAKIIPPVAGLDELNPHLSLEGTRLFIPKEPMAWRCEEPRVAAISAFGWSGTNAHVLIEEAPETPPSDRARETMIMVSAADVTALPGRALALADALHNIPDEMLESFAWTATVRRSHYGFRLAVAGRRCGEMADLLRDAARREAIPVHKIPPTIGFLIGDDAAGAVALGGELIIEEQTFHIAVAACAAAFDSIGESVMASCLTNFPRSASAIPDAVLVFVFAVGVAALLERWGVRALTTMGWGAGAAASAYLSHDITLVEAARRVTQGEDETNGPARVAEHRARADIDYWIRLDRLSINDDAAISGSARGRFMGILAEFAAVGVDLAWNEIFAPEARLVSLPAHSFHRRRYWITRAPAVESGSEVPSDPPDDWFFETRWRPKEESVAGGGDRSYPVKWLLLGEANGAAGQLASFIRDRNGFAAVQTVTDPNSTQLKDMLTDGRWTILDLRALDRRSGPVASEALRLAGQVVGLDRLLDRMPTTLEAKLWIVTMGSQCIAGEAPDLAAAPLWGLARSLGLAHPERWAGLIDLDPAAAFDPVQLYREIAGAGDTLDETAFRDGMRYVNRLIRMPAPSGTLRLDPAATYLVIGAFGGIGPALALWLARCGAKSLLLVGRSIDNGVGQDHPSRHLHQTLSDLGVAARVERCDIGDEAAVSALFASIRQSGVPLRGIVHAAAAATELVDEVCDSDLVAAFRPKVNGALLVDVYSRAFQLDFFVMFSSAAGVLGARGQAHYAAANTFLDALAASRRAEGLPGLSIAWGLWDESDAPRKEYYQRVGLDPMPPATALEAMARLISEQANGSRQFSPVVMSLDGKRLRSALELRGRARFLATLEPIGDAAESTGSETLAEQLRKVPATIRRGMIVDVIAAEVRAVMALAAEDKLNFERGFFDFGMDSLMTVALKARLEDRFGMSLPSTIAMDYPSVAALSGYFAVQLVGTGTVAIDFGEPVRAMRDPAPDAISAVEELSDDEVSHALAAELKAFDFEARE